MSALTNPLHYRLRIRGSEKVGEIPAGDDEPGFEVEMGDEPTEVEREKRRREVQKRQIAQCWEVLFSLDPGACSTLGARETEEEFAARRFTPLSPGEQGVVLLMRALVAPLVFSTKYGAGWTNVGSVPFGDA